LARPAEGVQRINVLPSQLPVERGREDRKKVEQPQVADWRSMLIRICEHPDIAANVAKSSGLPSVTPLRPRSGDQIRVA
jgi:hypothetical protein